jgi:hypothetical protein
VIADGEVRQRRADDDRLAGAAPLLEEGRRSAEPGLVGDVHLLPEAQVGPGRVRQDQEDDGAALEAIRNASDQGGNAGQQEDVGKQEIAERKDLGIPGGDQEAQSQRHQHGAQDEPLSRPRLPPQGEQTEGAHVQGDPVVLAGGPPTALRLGQHLEAKLGDQVGLDGRRPEGGLHLSPLPQEDGRPGQPPRCHDCPRQQGAAERWAAGQAPQVPVRTDEQVSQGEESLGGDREEGVVVRVEEGQGEAGVQQPGPDSPTRCVQGADQGPARTTAAP